MALSGAKFRVLLDSKQRYTCCIASTCALVLVPNVYNRTPASMVFPPQKKVAVFLGGNWAPVEVVLGDRLGTILGR